MTLRQNNDQYEWRHSVSIRLAPKISECKHQLENFSFRFLWYLRGVLLSVLLHLKDILKENAPTPLALGTQKKLAYQNFQCLDHPPYSPDMAPFNYHLFPGLKNN
jgi:hypothetical protein